MFQGTVPLSSSWLQRRQRQTRLNSHWNTSHHHHHPRSGTLSKLDRCCSKCGCQRTVLASPGSPLECKFSSPPPPLSESESVRAGPEMFKSYPQVISMHHVELEKFSTSPVLLNGSVRRSHLGFWLHTLIEQEWNCRYWGGAACESASLTSSWRRWCCWSADHTLWQQSPNYRIKREGNSLMLSPGTLH